MKKANKFLALLIAALLMISAFAFGVLAEGETTDPNNEDPSAESNTEESNTEDPGSGESSDPGTGESSDPGTGESSDPENGESSDPGTEPDPNAYNVNIVINGVDVSAVNVLMNGTSVSGSTYSSSVLPLVVQAEAASGYKITSATFGVDGFAQPLTESEGKYNGSFSNLSAGYTYTLKITAELIPVPVELKVETVGATGYTVAVNGETVDLATASIMTGSNVTVSFSVEGEFDASKAMLMHDGSAKTLTEASYSFVISANTKIVFTYGNLIPITVTLNGPGTLEFQKTEDSSPVDSIKNDTNTTSSKTFYVNKDEGLKIKITPALGYELGNCAISEPRRVVDNGVYFFIPSGATTVDVTMKEATFTPPTSNCTVQINVGMGGKVVAGAQSILGGFGSNVMVVSGESLTLTFAPDAGYVVDVVTVNGIAVALTGNSYTISNITATTTMVSVMFRSEVDTPVVGNGIGKADIDWSANPIIVDVSGGKAVKREVFEHIATLAAGNGYVEFRSENGTIYYPFGKSVEGSALNANMSISTLNSGAVYESIAAALNGSTDPYRIYSFNIGLIMPEGTLVSFKLGSEFVGSSAEMKRFNSGDNKLVSISDALETAQNGESGLFAYNDEAVVVVTETSGIIINASVIKGVGTITPEGETAVEKGASQTYIIKANEGFFIGRILINDEEIEITAGLTETEYTFENVTESQTIKVEFITETADISQVEEKGGATTAIVIIIIVLVAVAGAAALFIVKWRQEKF